jgi:hypothetical protein
MNPATPEFRLMRTEMPESRTMGSKQYPRTDAVHNMLIGVSGGDIRFNREYIERQPVARKQMHGLSK